MYAALCAHMYYVPVLRGVVFAVLRRLTQGPSYSCACKSDGMDDWVGRPPQLALVCHGRGLWLLAFADCVGWPGESSATVQLLAILGCSTYVFAPEMRK